MKTKIFLMLNIMIMITSSSNEQTSGQKVIITSSDSISNDVLLKLVKNRRSLRSYTDEKIAPEILEK